MSNKLDVFNGYHEQIFDVHFANKAKGVEVIKLGSRGYILRRLKTVEGNTVRVISVLSRLIPNERFVEISTRNGDITITVTVKVSREELEEWLEQRKG